MDNKERLERIDIFFKKISIEEFDEMLVRAGINKVKLNKELNKKMSSGNNYEDDFCYEDYDVNEIIYALFYDEDEDMVMVYTTTLPVWEKNKCVADFYSRETEDSLDAEFEKIGLYRESTSLYAFDRENVSMEEAKTLLQGTNLSFREDFQEWILNN